jgi:hypothetical protein
MLAGLALAALVVSAVAAGRWGRVGVPPLVVCSVLWLVANKPMEGVVLYVVSPGRGLVAADLAGLAGLVLALVILLSPHRR